MRHTEHLFRPYWFSLAVDSVISTTEDRTSDHRIHSRNSTTELSVHLAHKRSRTEHLLDFLIMVIQYIYIYILVRYQ